MKQTFIAITLFIALTTSAFADGKNSNAKLLGSLKTAIKSIKESAWKTTDEFKKTSFSFNNTTVNAYLTADGADLLGFGIQIKPEDLPAGTMQNIEKKFKGWTVTSAILFITADGNSDYYAQVFKDNDNLALSVSPKGKISIYAKMPN